MDHSIIAVLRARLLDRVRSEAVLLGGHEQPDAGRRADIVAWCHRLGGTAGTLGFTDISAAALAVEDALLHEKPDSWPELRNDLLATLRDCSL